MHDISLPAAQMFVFPIENILQRDVGNLTSKLVKLPTPPPEDILNSNHKQLRDGKGYAAHQETTNFI